ncbi:uncharacterized protein SSO0011 [Nanoarchaeota archaeon]
MDKKLLLFLLLFLLFPIHSQMNLIIYPQVNQIIEGGQNFVPITFTIINAGPTLFNVTFYPINEFPFYQANYYNNTQNITIEQINQGQNITITLFYYISPNINPGIYEIQVGAYEYYYGLQNSEILNTSIPILGYTNFSINSFFGTQNNIILPYNNQKDVPLTFVIINDGNTILNNVTVYFNNNSNIEFLENQYYIGILPIGQPYFLTTYVNINNLSTGINYVTLNISYFDGDYQTINVPINFGYTNIGINTYTNPVTIYPGNPVLLDSIIFNYGNQPAGNFYINIYSPFELLTSNYYNLGILYPGSIYNISSLIYIPSNTSPGYYPIIYELNYNNQQYNYTYYIHVLGEANISITNVYYNNLYPGSSEVPITVNIKNIGNVEAKNLIAIIGSNNVIYPYVSSSNPLRALTASEINVGNLYPNQSINITFIIKVSSGANYGNYSLPIIFVWNQSESLYPFSQEENINIQVIEPFYYNPEFYIKIIIPIIIVIIIGLMLYKFRKRKNKK